MEPEKTTLLRIIMGLLPPDGGKVSLFEQLSPGDSKAHARIGYMPQRLAIYPGLSVRENIRFFGQLYRVPPTALKARTDELLELVSLQHKADDRVADLSGGMARRTMLATALVHRPQLIILDEPTAGVDPLLRLRFWSWFRELRSTGASMIITTHHISEADACQRVAFLRQGRLLEQGTPEELKARYTCSSLEAAFVQATGEET